MNGLTGTVLVFLAVMTIAGYLKGFLRTIYSLVSGVLIFVLVLFANPLVTKVLVECTSLETVVEEKCHEQLRMIVRNSANNKESQKEELVNSEQLKDMGIVLPEILIEKLLGTEDYADELLEKSGVYDELSVKAAAIAIKGIAFILTFVLINLVAIVLYRVFHVIEKLPVIATANKGLGGGLGFLEGIAVVWIFFAIVAMTATSEFSSGVIKNVYDSLVLTMIYENNPILILLVSIF